MGRRGVGVERDDRWVFNRLAGAYRARPGYPADLVDLLARLARPGRRILDLGAGTGLLALPLAARGLRVTAVEPARRMREVLAEAATVRGLAVTGPSGAVAPGPRVAVVAAPAEETGLPAGGYDLAVIADALHWIDPERGGREVARLVAPGGAVAVIEARPADTPFMAEVTALVEAANPKARRKPAARGAEQLLAHVAAGPLERWAFRQEELLDPARLGDVLRSLSTVGAALGPVALDRLLADAVALAERHGGAAWARDLAVTVARRAP